MVTIKVRPRTEGHPYTIRCTEEQARQLRHIGTIEEYYRYSQRLLNAHIKRRRKKADEQLTFF